jgi:hypothetical protein
MFQTKLGEKIDTHILFSITFFLNRAFYGVPWKKNCRAVEATDDNMAHALWMLNKISFRSLRINISKKTLEDGTYGLSRNVGNKLALYAA